MNRRQLLALTPALFIPKVTKTAPKCKVTFELLDIEGSVRPRGINNNGDIAGTLISDAGTTTGFVLKATGEIILLAPPRAALTAAWGIDDDGSVVGWYVEQEGDPLKAFLWQNGQYTTLIYGAETVAYGVYQGKVVGHFNQGGQPSGFLWENGQFTRLDFPGTLGLGATIPYGIHEGRIVGRYDSPQLQKGFIYENGQFETISFPESLATEIYDVSSKAILGAVWLNQNETRFQPFVLTKGRFHLLDLPGTNIFGINDVGQIVGDYGTGKGFIADLRSFITHRNHTRPALNRLLDPLGGVQ